MTSDRGRELADQVLGLCPSGSEAEITVIEGESGLTRFANSFIHQNVAEEDLAVHLRLVVDGRLAGASTTAVDDEGLKRLVDTTVEVARLRPADPDWPGLAPVADVPGVDHYDDATAAADPAARAAVVKAFVDAGPGLLAAGFCDTEEQRVTFANSLGQRAFGRSTRATIDGIHQTDRSAGEGHQTSVRLRDLDGGAVGSAAAQKARESAEAVDIEPGHYEVVFEPECVAEMVSFLGFYGFNAKQVIEEQSFVRLGEQQFDEAITIVDDATDPRAVGIGFDIEGTPKAPLDLVRSGVSAAIAHDRRTARRIGGGAASTGHAIPGGESWGAFAANLFVAPGDQTLDELIGAVERGLLVTEFNYCRILDPKTQVVTGLTRNGTFLIENGKIAGAVKNLRFTQSFVEALGPGNVLGVGSQARFAEAEFGVGMVVAPPMRLGSFHFTGGARG